MEPCAPLPQRVAVSHDPASDDRRSEALHERLVGLGLILGGLLAFAAVYVLWLLTPAAIPAPPGIPRDLLPLTSPVNCILPISAIGASALVLIGLRKTIMGE